MGLTVTQWKASLTGKKTGMGGDSWVPGEEWELPGGQVPVGGAAQGMHKGAEAAEDRSTKGEVSI